MQQNKVITCSKSIKDGSSSEYCGSTFTRQGLHKESSFVEVCFCDKPATSGESLSKASTFQLDFKVRQCAMKLQDRQLLAKLSVGDLIA